MTGTETKWSERVREWGATGRTAVEFSEGRGFAASTLRYWASRLRHPERYSAADAKPTRRIRMVRVTPAATRREETLDVVVGAARVVVRTGFDGALLREVVDALGGAK
jgi:ABC-type amino acid transport substrate-binding protein